ncbi:ATP-dependent RNA helicase DDX47/RRP3 [Nematocida homosporus]|uniref:ATP-dependent RNA helicase DDX47/RRP3 n=1 Tax=Nematocida homosporus TaxID=1912981 RepID=UPI00221F4715|nr:ATP-dependent RNA helicase DDX47/RRP3 [Nematocida homosporus]KAI5186371.1 ATP-dependent RNA helicase DDX47/RRP3 [Nematocida homosporus]
MTNLNDSFNNYGLDNDLVGACTKMGLSQPTPIQKCVFEALNRKKDILAISGTGTGKTIAFALPILHHLLKADRYFYALVLLPTRELSQQVHSVFCELGKEFGLRTTLLIGGVDLLVQGKSLAARPHIIVGTPGRIAYHFKNTKGIHLDAFKYLVLDECDRLLDGDFEGEVKEILDMIGPKRLNFLFTATITKRVASLKAKMLNDPLVFETKTSEGVPEDLVQNYVYLPLRYKEIYLYEIIRTLGMSKAIVFVSTCVAAEKLERLLVRLGELVCSIHGSKPQQERTAIIEAFKSGSKNVLIATDVVARGIDIPTVRIVINYDIPECSKDYIHRVGRTARAGQSGRAITLVTQYDVEDFQKLEIKLGTRMAEYQIDTNNITAQIDMVASAKREADLEMKEEGVGQRIKDHKNHKKGKPKSVVKKRKAGLTTRSGSSKQ